MGIMRLRALGDQPHMVEGMSNYVAENAESVCSVCGLQVMGHRPESQWLGHESHDWQPIPATPDQVRRAEELTREAYRLRYRASA